MVNSPEIIRKEIKDKRAGRIIIQYCYKHDHTILHREDGPAVICKTKSGKVLRKWWYKHGVLHRDNGPAVIEIYESYDGNWNCDMVYYQNGKHHRKDGPAIIRTFPDHVTHWYYKFGNRHNINGPAEIDYYDDGTIESNHHILGYYVEEDKFKQIKQELFLRETPMGSILGTPVLDNIKFNRIKYVPKYFRDNL